MLVAKWDGLSLIGVMADVHLFLKDVQVLVESKVGNRDVMRSGPAKCVVCV